MREPLLCPQLGNLHAIRHGFFTRDGGVSQGVFASLNCAHGTGDDAANVEENFNRIAKALGVQKGYVLKAWQVHGTEVMVATNPWSFETRPKVDAIVTRIHGLAVSVTTADCAPVLFADAKAGVVAAAHAGWKGALSGIIQNTVKAMLELGADVSSIHATVGPCIQQQSYEVGEEFYARFMEQSADNAVFFIPSGRIKHYLFDLPAFVHKQLQISGIKHINLLARDTSLEEDTFFSYRRTSLRGETAYGCQLSAIVLT